MTTTDYSQWFQEQLKTSADGFVWGADQVPEGRRDKVPPGGLGEWPATRHVFHMLFYERTIALPSMRQWLGASLPSLDDVDEDVAWLAASRDLDQLLAAFREVRAEQITLLPQFDLAVWLAPRDTVWGAVPLRWVVSKTYQHTAEHTNDILRIALFWDAFEAHPR